MWRKEMWRGKLPWVCATLLLIALGDVEGSVYPTPPLPLLPIPSFAQLKFQAREMAMFFHFGVNTFTDSELGTGKEDPDVFNPEGLDTAQWAKLAKSTGFKLVILVAKHHDGFCVWQSRYTNHSVASSRWRNGKGDVLKEFVDSAKVEGLDVGVYLSPWDRHEECYGEQIGYNEYYLAQIRELLTMYGTISEVWLDGFKPPDAVKMDYLYSEWFDTIHQLQPQSSIFSDAGPNIRWVGNEGGEAGSSCWGMVNVSQLIIGHANESYLYTGDQYGTDWVPPECDVSIRPGWFWHKDQEPRGLSSLLDLYYKSTGRNCVLLLNVPPNSTGLIAEQDIERLHEFKRVIDSIFSLNLAEGAQVSATSLRGAEILPDDRNPFRPSQILNNDLSTYWVPADDYSLAALDISLTKGTKFNVLQIQEAVGLGQRVIRYHLEILRKGKWEVVVNGTTIGYKKLDQFSIVEAKAVRLVIDEARGPPLIAYFGLYLDLISSPASSLDMLFTTNSSIEATSKAS